MAKKKKCNVVFERQTGKVKGILIGKKETELFFKQRDINVFVVIPMTPKEVDDAFEYYDQANYIPMYVDDLIIFPHEEFTMNEIVMSEAQQFLMRMPDTIDTFLDNVRFTKDELSVVKVALGTTLNVYGGIDDLTLDFEEVMDTRNSLLSVMKLFDVRKDYK